LFANHSRRGAMFSNNYLTADSDRELEFHTDGNGGYYFWAVLKLNSPTNSLKTMGTVMRKGPAYTAGSRNTYWELFSVNSYYNRYSGLVVGTANGTSPYFAAAASVPARFSQYHILSGLITIEASSGYKSGYAYSFYNFGTSGSEDEFGKVPPAVQPLMSSACPKACCAHR